MAFFNTDSSLIIDSLGDIYSFKLTEGGIELIVHEKFTNQMKDPLIISRDVLEYDVSINEKDEIDLFCKKKDKSLSIYRLNEGKWIESKISKELDLDICGLKITSLNDTIHIFYYMKSLENIGRLNIYHHYIRNEKWNTNIVKEVYESKIIKPIEVIKSKNEIIIGYYDLGQFSEDIFIKKFNLENNTWGESINVTNNEKIKLYLDILCLEEDIHITYSEYEDENLIINHKKIDINFKEVDGILENVLSNQTNCTYPTLVSEMGLLWAIWTEYESVVSSYSNDGGITWSNPYIWRDSKEEDFTRYKFNTNNMDVKEAYEMNYSFGKLYPELSFLGFGDLSRAIKSEKKKTKLRMM